MVELTEGRVLASIDRSWRGDTGEYPGLHAWMVGGWWAVCGGGQPGRPAVRAVGLVFGLITAAACASAARRVGQGRRYTYEAGWIAALLLPQANGLWRHTMPEGLLVAVAAVALAVALWADERPGWRRAAWLGLVFGAAMLVKQTAPIYLLPALWAARRNRIKLLAVVVVAGALAAPWYLGHWGRQIAYGASSVEARADVGLGMILAYYPVVLLWFGLGPVGVMAFAQAWRRLKGRRALLVGLGLGLLLLVAIPKKYPRLLAAFTPAVAVFVGAVARRDDWIAVPLCAGWLGLASLVELPLPPIFELVDPGCPQRFLGPPLRDDLGLSAVSAAAAQAGPGPIIVIGAPEIPCEVRPTHPWIVHLEPYLRRDGQDRQIKEEGVGALTIDWRSGPGQQIDVPALHSQLWIR